MILISRISSAKAKAEEKIDSHYDMRIYRLLGPNCLVHLIKRMQVLNGGGVLTSGDEAAIRARINEQDDALTAVDTERRGFKARIRASGTVAEITAILAELPQ